MTHDDMVDALVYAYRPLLPAKPVPWWVRVWKWVCRAKLSFVGYIQRFFTRRGNEAV